MASFLLSFFLLFLSVEITFASRKNVGNVKDYKGSANILREKRELGLHIKDPVFMADTVRTLDKSRVKLLFIDDSLVMVGENTDFIVSEYFRGRKKVSVFRLLNGVMNVIVGKSEFEVHTATAITAARGTSFLVWTGKDRTGLAVTEGKVELSNSDPAVGGRKVVHAGRTSYVDIGKPPVVAVKTYPDMIKRFYIQTLAPEERWGPVILTATGSGAPPEKTANSAQARLLALRAAKVEALRNLLERAKGVAIVGNTTIGDFILKSDAIKSHVDGFIKGAWVSEERKLADGSYEVDMEIALGIGFRRIFLEQNRGNKPDKN